MDTLDYVSTTIHDDYHARYAYLPTYPTESNDFREHLLLANVPSNRLGRRQILQRQQEIDSHVSQNIIGGYDTKELHSISFDNAMELVERLRMDLSVLLFTANRMRAYCSYFTYLYERYQYKVLRQPEVLQEQRMFIDRQLSSYQMSILLEFFLQLDVDVFFMKTCSFRGAQPVSTEQGLFCDERGPSSSYSWTFCQQSTCPCCDRTWNVIDRDQTSTYRFINGYQTYLNCPMTCTTTNLIYAMQCSCCRYDYVGSTNRTLAEEMIGHRHHYFRVIHHALTGTALSEKWIANYDRDEHDRLRRMRLYQHVARCPVALGRFLQFNPQYWCFIPQLIDEDQPTSTDVFGEPLYRDSEIEYLFDQGIIVDVDVIRCLQRVPQPPVGYRFTYQQRQQQRFFFKHLLTDMIGQLPYRPVDLYRYAIVTVLPEETSNFARYILETFFVIHGECKLNMICPCGGDPKRTYGQPYDSIWCNGLELPCYLGQMPMVLKSDMFTCL